MGSGRRGQAAMFAWFCLTLVIAIGVGGCSPPALARGGDLVVADGYAYPSMGDGASAFLVIRNEGGLDDTLTAVESAAAGMVMPHGTEVAGGAGRMVHLDAIPIPAGGAVPMDSGGLHLMLRGLRRPLVVGDSCALLLRFARAGTLRVTVPVVGFSDRP